MFILEAIFCNFLFFTVDKTGRSYLGIVQFIPLKTISLDRHVYGSSGDTQTGGSAPNGPPPLMSLHVPGLVHEHQMPAASYSGHSAPTPSLPVSNSTPDFFRALPPPPPPPPPRPPLHSYPYEPGNPLSNPPPYISEQNGVGNLGAGYAATCETNGYGFSQSKHQQ